ncbi:protein FAM122B isoform X1 [Narcine bancroftii]|uniref:protein FAM122B isoform X1 n=1 Tax=Narcine bancroftii TaxID=1343680 RepID=UPI003831E7D5
MAAKKEKPKTTGRKEEGKTSEEEGEGLTCPKRPAAEREARSHRSVEVPGSGLQNWLAEPSKSAQPRMKKKHTDGRGEQLRSQSPQLRETPAAQQQVQNTDNNDNKKEEGKKKTRKQEMANPEEEEEEQKEVEEEEKGKKMDVSFFKEYMESLKEWQLQEFDEIKRRIKNAEERMNKMEVAISELAKRVENMEKRETFVDMEVKDLKEKLEESNKKAKEAQELLAQKIDMIENYNRRNNIKIVGLKEDEEGKNMREFIKDWIPRVLGRPESQEEMEIEGAHRTLARKPQPQQKPRSILVKFLRYTTRENILEKAMKKVREDKKLLEYKGQKNFFYPDISFELLKKRKEFNTAKTILWKKGYKFMLRYPAVLKIIIPGQRNRLFSDPEEARKFAEQLQNKQR